MQGNTSLQELHLLAGQSTFQCFSGEYLNRSFEFCIPDRDMRGVMFLDAQRVPMIRLANYSPFIPLACGLEIRAVNE